MIKSERIMSKELTPLQALETIKNNYLLQNELIGNEIDIIETALKDYEKLKLKGDEIKDYLYYSHKEFLEDRKKLKALEIIKKIFQYDVEVNGNEIFEEEYEPNEVITKEEYELLKEVLL